MQTNRSYQTAQPQDREGLITLWQNSFGDCRKSIMEFYDSFPCENNIFVAKEDNRIVGAVHAVPMRVLHKGSFCDAAYLYAISVQKELRGQGIFRALDAYTKNKLESRGCQLVFLVAANDGLVQMYSKFGYRCGIRRKDPQILTQECGARESYMRYRRFALVTEGALLPDLPFFLYGMKNAARSIDAAVLEAHTLHCFLKKDWDHPLYAAMLADEEDKTEPFGN